MNARYKKNDMERFLYSIISIGVILSILTILITTVLTKYTIEQEKLKPISYDNVKVKHNYRIDGVYQSYVDKHQHAIQKIEEDNSPYDLPQQLSQNVNKPQRYQERIEKVKSKNVSLAPKTQSVEISTRLKTIENAMNSIQSHLSRVITPETLRTGQTLIYGQTLKSFDQKTALVVNGKGLYFKDLGTGKTLHQLSIKPYHGVFLTEKMFMDSDPLNTFTINKYDKVNVFGNVVESADLTLYNIPHNVMITKVTPHIYKTLADMTIEFDGEIQKSSSLEQKVDNWNWTINDKASFVCIDVIDNSVVMGGSFSSFGSYGPSMLSSISSKDGIVVKLSSNGSFTWATRFTTNVNETLIVDISVVENDIWVVGTFKGTLRSLVSDDVSGFIARMDNSGAITLLEKLSSIPISIKTSSKYLYILYNDNVSIHDLNNEILTSDPLPFDDYKNMSVSGSMVFLTGKNVINLNRWKKSIESKILSSSSFINLEGKRFVLTFGENYITLIDSENGDIIKSIMVDTPMKNIASRSYKDSVWFTFDIDNLLEIDNNRIGIQGKRCQILAKMNDKTISSLQILKIYNNDDELSKSKSLFISDAFSILLNTYNDKTTIIQFDINNKMIRKNMFFALQGGTKVTFNPCPWTGINVNPNTEIELTEDKLIAKGQWSIDVKDGTISYL